MDDLVRNVAWAIAEASWRKRNRVAGGTVPEATNSTDYADNFWQNYVEEARAAAAALERASAAKPSGLSASVPLI